MSSISEADRASCEVRLLLEPRPALRSVPEAPSVFWLSIESESVALEEEAEAEDPSPRPNPVEEDEEDVPVASDGGAPVGVEGCCWACSKPHIAANTVRHSIRLRLRRTHRTVVCFVIGSTFEIGLRSRIRAR